jgi:hypothetical protein
MYYLLHKKYPNYTFSFYVLLISHYSSKANASTSFGDFYAYALMFTYGLTTRDYLLY